MVIARAGLCVALFLLPQAALAKQWKPTFDRGRATWILRQLHRFNQIQIEAAKIASRKAMAEELRQLASHVREEHEKLDRRVLAWAKHHRLRIGAEWKATGGDQLEALSAAAPVEVDRMYLTMLLVEHRNWVPLLRKHSNEIRHKALSRFLESISKSLAEHQRMTLALEQQLRAEG